MASSPAAFTSGTPKLTQNGIKCGWIRPLVLAPQMKKVPDRTQNTRVLAACRSASMAAKAIDASNNSMQICFCLLIVTLAK